MVFCFVQNFFFGQHESQNIFFLSRKAQFFPPEFNIRLYDNNSESDYFFFPPPKSEYFFQQHWEKTITPLQVKWSFPQSKKNQTQYLILVLLILVAFEWKIKQLPHYWNSSKIQQKNCKNSGKFDISKTHKYGHSCSLCGTDML